MFQGRLVDKGDGSACLAGVDLKFLIKPVLIATEER